MKKYTINTKTTYTKNGEEKALWNRVGFLKVMDDGKQFVELFMFPNTSFYVFEDTPKETTQENKVETVAPEGKGIDMSEFTDENIDISQIPF
jgi:hypothetical protein